MQPSQQGIWLASQWCSGLPATYSDAAMLKAARPDGLTLDPV